MGNKKKPGKKAKKVRDLPLSKRAGPKGGALLSSSVSSTVKNVGQALQTAARG